MKQLIIYSLLLISLNSFGQDTKVTIRGSGGGGLQHVVGQYGLIQVNDSTLKADSTLLLTKLGAAAIYQPLITLTTTGSGAATFVANTLNIPTPSIPAQFNPIAGTNVTLTGSYPNITFNAAGSAQVTADSTLTATGGQTAFVFSSVPASPSDYEIHVNGTKWDYTTGFTTSGNTITVTTALFAGDLVNYSRKK